MTEFKQLPSCNVCGKQLSKRIGNDNKHTNVERTPKIIYFCSREHKLKWVQNYDIKKERKKSV